MSISIDSSGGPVWPTPAPQPAPKPVAAAGANAPGTGAAPAVKVDLGAPKEAPVLTYDKLITTPMPNPAPAPATPPTPIVKLHGSR